MIQKIGGIRFNYLQSFKAQPEKPSKDITDIRHPEDLADMTLEEIMNTKPTELSDRSKKFLEATDAYLLKFAEEVDPAKAIVIIQQLDRFAGRLRQSLPEPLQYEIEIEPEGKDLAELLMKEIVEVFKKSEDEAYTMLSHLEDNLFETKYKITEKYFPEKLDSNLQ